MPFQPSSGRQPGGHRLQVLVPGGLLDAPGEQPQPDPPGVQAGQPAKSRVIAPRSGAAVLTAGAGPGYSSLRKITPRRW